MFAWKKAAMVIARGTAERSGGGRTPSPRAHPGYTLVEVLLVVTVIGIAGAIVVPQMLQAGEMGVQAAARMLVADILYAQNDAVARQQPRRIIFDAPNDAYRITDQNDQTIVASWKGGGLYQVSLASDDRFDGVEVASADFGGVATLDFDDLGAAVAGGAIELNGPNVVYRITVAPFTGQVTVEEVAGG